MLVLAAVLPLRALAAQPGASRPAAAPAPVTVVLETTLGEIHIALETARAPLTAKNFLQYVDSGRFNGVTFYRAMRALDDGSAGLVQGGVQGSLGRSLPPVKHESTVDTGLSHVDGAVSMARGRMLGTARGDFFIIVGDMRVTYDGVPDGGDPGYAVFGQVVQGMPIVRRMMQLPRAKTAANQNMQGQMLAEPVKIVAARRLPAARAAPQAP